MSVVGPTGEPVAETVDVDLTAKKLMVDGAPFPWLITGFRIAAADDNITVLTVDIPVRAIAIEMDAGGAR